MDKKDEEQHAMSKPKPLEDPLTEVKKKPEFRYYMDAGGNPQKLDKKWKTWLDKKESEQKPKKEEPRERTLERILPPKKEEPEIEKKPVPKEEEEEETIVDNAKQVAGAEAGEGLLHLVGLGKDHLDDEKREYQRKREQKRSENFHSDFSSDSDKMTPTPEQIANKKIRDDKEAKIAADKKERHSKGARTAARNRKLKKTYKKIARLGDLSQYKLPKSKPSKYKDQQTMSKFPKKLGKPVRKIESAEIDNEGRVDHGQWKKHENPGSVAGVETKQPSMSARADDLKPESLGDKVQHKKPNQALEGRATPLTETDPVKTDYGSSPTEDLEQLPPATYPTHGNEPGGSTGLREQRVGVKRIKTPYGKQQGGDADVEFFSGKQKAIFDRFRKRRSTNAQPEDLKRDDKPQSSLNPKPKPSTSIQAPDTTVGTTKPQKQTKIETSRYMATVPKESKTPPDKFPKSHEAKPKVSQMGRIQANQGKKEPPMKQTNPLQALAERKQPERTTAIGTGEPEKPTKERKVPHAKEAAILLKALMIKMYMIDKRRKRDPDIQDPTGSVDPKTRKRTTHDTISGGFATAKVPRKQGIMGSNVKEIKDDKDQADPPNVTTTHPGGEIGSTTSGADTKLQQKKPRTSKPKPVPKPIKGAPIKKGLGALGEGKLNRRTGKPMKLVPRKNTLDEYPKDNKPSYFKQIASEEEKKNKDEIIEAHIAAQVNKDYFVEEIRAEIIYQNKIAPLLGMVAGKIGGAVLGAGKKMAEGVKQTGQWLVTPQEEEEE